MKSTVSPLLLILSLLLTSFPLVLSSDSCDSIENTCSHKFISLQYFPSLQAEGAGAEVLRIIGSSTLKSLDPFLLLDHFSADTSAGFPDHPHRGFETVSYILKGACMHEDFKGNKGEITEGGVQWMTAGRGIVHAEMPGPGGMEGFQLWVNLKRKDKMIEPQYQERLAEEILKIEKEGVTVKVIAGESLGGKAEMVMRTEVYFLDIEMQENTDFTQAIPQGWNSLVYVINGTVEIGGKYLVGREAGILSKFGSTVFITTEKGSRLLVIAGKKIDESVVQHGPFVMNEASEINQAMSDYRMGVNGFEGATKWKSSFS